MNTRPLVLMGALLSAAIWTGDARAEAPVTVGIDDGSLVPHAAGHLTYPAPLQTPPHVGHTYITYPAFYPHMFVFPRHMVGCHYDECGNVYRTTVSYGWMPYCNPSCHTARYPRPAHYSHGCK